MTKEEYIAEGHKVLTLQIDRQCFEAIKNGSQKTEHRYIYPNNTTRYVYFEADGKPYKSESDIPQDVSEVKPVPIKYDALYLINGRRKDAPRMMVEIESAEFVVMTDDEGNDLTYLYNGEEYVACQVWYHLSRVLFTENIKAEDENAYLCGGMVYYKP